MTDTIIKVDLKQSAYDNDMVHNRWHPEIPMVATVKPGDDFIIETYDWTGGFIKNNDDASDVRDIDLSIVHFLSGPVGVTGAEPGDLLVEDRHARRTVRVGLGVEAPDGAEDGRDAVLRERGPVAGEVLDQLQRLLGVRGEGVDLVAGLVERSETGWRLSPLGAGR